MFHTRLWLLCVDIFIDMCEQHQRWPTWCRKTAAHMQGFAPCSALKSTCLIAHCYFWLHCLHTALKQTSWRRLRKNGCQQFDPRDDVINQREGVRRKYLKERDELFILHMEHIVAVSVLNQLVFPVCRSYSLECIFYQVSLKKRNEKKTPQDYREQVSAISLTGCLF